MDAADPETFVTAVAAVLSDYPEAVVSRVTDPRTGLPGKQAFPPSPFEVKTACEVEMAPLRRQQEREARTAQAHNLLAAPVPDRSTRPTLDELKTRLGPTWGIIQQGVQGDPKKVRSETVLVRAAKINLARLAREARNPAPITVGEGLAAKLDAMRRDFGITLVAAE